MNNLTPAQQRQQSNRTNDGKYTTKQHSEAEVDLGLDDPAQVRQYNRRIEVIDLGERFDGAWTTINSDGQPELLVGFSHDTADAIPEEYAALYRHDAKEWQQYLADRQHVIEAATAEFYGGAAKITGHTGGSAQFEVVKDLDEPVDDDTASVLIEEEFEPDNPHTIGEYTAYLQSALRRHDATKLPNPQSIDEAKQQQFVDSCISTLIHDAQQTYDDGGVHDEDVRLAIDSEVQLREMLADVYADNAGDIETWRSTTKHEPGSEAYLAAAGYAEDLEHASTDLNSRVIGRRLERSFVAEMPKLDTASGRLEIEDDGMIHLHPSVHGAWKARRVIGSPSLQVPRTLSEHEQPDTGTATPAEQPHRRWEIHHQAAL